MLVDLQLTVPDPEPVTVDPERTLVVLVDLENEYCEPAGARYMGPEVEGAVRGSAALVDEARQVGARVLWIRSVRSPDALEFRAYGRQPALIEGTWATEYTQPLAPGEGETVIAKRSHDCFNRTGLEEWLEAEQIIPPDWTILVAGVALDVCVNHAVLGFSVRAFRVVVLVDCVAPRTGPRAATTLWHYGYRAYAYNVSVSSSDLVTWSRSHVRAIETPGR